MDSGSAPTPFRVAVVGGGVSGLAAAHRLTELQTDRLPVVVRLFEASGRLGGALNTQVIDGYQVELGSDSFITNRPWALGLCKRVGLEDELIRTNDSFRKTYVVHRGRLAEVPEGFLLMAPSRIGSVLRSPILSWRGKLRLGLEYFIPRRKTEKNADGQPMALDESLAGFVTRRLGREAFERLVQPLVGGIYTADAELLSLRATLPRFLDMEQQHGGLIRAARAEAQSRPKSAPGEISGARYSLFVTPRRGLSSLTQALVDRLAPGSVRLNAGVASVEPSENGWQVLAGGSAETFDAVIVACPAPKAAQILRSHSIDLSDRLAKIPYAGAAVASLGYDRRQIGRKLDGFGFVVPEVEGRKILACSFSSVKFAGRAPEGKELFRVFLGGAKHPEFLDMSDAELVAAAQAELADLLHIAGPPEMSVVSRYGGAMPQYHVGHLDHVSAIDSQVAALPGLEMAGNAYHGVGIPDCIHSGEQAAELIFAWLQTRSSSAAAKANP